MEYRVGNNLKFLGNLDMINLMSRVLRRARTPFALSEGFNPHIKLSLGTVLPVGVWGEREYLDLELAEEIEPTVLVEQLNRVLPSDMEIKRCIKVDEKQPALMKTINAASYSFILESNDDYLALPERIMGEEQLLVKSRGKQKGVDKDLRPGIYKITVLPQEESVIIKIWVNVGEPVNVRYDELRDLLVAQGVKPEAIVNIFRSGNYIRIGTDFYSPLEKVS
jgi:radical SAM-linked protein